MGFKVTDVTPLLPLGPTTNIPASKDVVTKVFQVSRTDTVATLKAVLPADASILEVNVYGSVASDAGTTAAVTVTAVNNTGTISTGSYDVKTNGAVNGTINMTNLPNLEQLPLTGDIRINAVYAETGTAGTTGGPWKVVILYVR